MREEEALAMVSVMVGCVVVVWMLLAHWHKRERLRTIQRAIESGHLDEATRRQVLEILTADSRRAAEFWQRLWPNLVHLARRVVFIGGWLTLMIGGGMWIAMEIGGTGSRYDTEGAMVATVIGMALVTLPLALRELDARRAASRP
jgi:hypothetical protein